MNVYQYLNSKDVAEHLEKIGFQFTSLEAASVIENCNHINLAEKHDAFRRLTEEMPDEEITLPAECGWAAEETTVIILPMRQCSKTTTLTHTAVLQML